MIRILNILFKNEQKIKQLYHWTMLDLHFDERNKIKKYYYVKNRFFLRGGFLIIVYTSSYFINVWMQCLGVGVREIQLGFWCGPRFSLSRHPSEKRWRSLSWIHRYSFIQSYSIFRTVGWRGGGGGYIIYDQTKPGGKIRLRFITQYFETNITALLFF